MTETRLFKEGALDSTTLLADAHYEYLLREVPPGTRGYLYVYQDGYVEIDQEAQLADTRDLVIGHEELGNVSYGAHPRDKDIVQKLSDTDIRAVPFIKLDDLAETEVPFDEFAKMRLYNGSETNEFFVFDSTFGIFYQQYNLRGDQGYVEHLAVALTELKESTEYFASEQRKILSQRGIDPIRVPQIRQPAKSTS